MVYILFRRSYVYFGGARLNMTDENFKLQILIAVLLCFFFFFLAVILLLLMSSDLVILNVIGKGIAIVWIVCGILILFRWLV